MFIEKSDGITRRKGLTRRGNFNYQVLDTVNKSLEVDFVDVPIEAVTWRVQVRGPVPAVQVIQKSDNNSGGEAFKGNRKVYFQETGYLDCPVYNRYALRTNEELNGPAIVEEKESTLVIGINASFYLDSLKNIVISMPE